MSTDWPDVPCCRCGPGTRILGTALCDRCWELAKRVQSNPDLAEEILLGMEEWQRFEMTQTVDLCRARWWQFWTPRRWRVVLTVGLTQGQGAGRLRDNGRTAGGGAVG